MRHNRIILAALLAYALLPCLAGADEVQRHFDIQQQGLASALNEFARQSDRQILFSTEAAGTKHTDGVMGDLAPDAALRILLQGTGLSFRVTSDNTILIEQTHDGAQSTELQEVVVAGSRIPRTAQETAQEVKIYAKEQIAQSGQTTVSDFLNTLPDVSVSVGEQGLRTQSGGTTVQLHGLPLGSTLLLIDGRRVESSAVQVFTGTVFDLNNLPLSAVERIEILPEGASAIYGSDAIAGVVNIVLRKDFDGIEANVKYGHAIGMDETDVSAAWGRHWSRGSLSVLGSYMDRSALPGAARALTANSDFTRFGGIDARYEACPLADFYSLNGGNLPGTSSPYAAVAPGSSAQAYRATPGLNKCTLTAAEAIFPQTRRTGLLLQGDYQVTASVTAFTTVMFSHIEEAYPNEGRLLLFGEPGYQQFTVSAANPYNPYGQNVGVSQNIPVPDIGGGQPVTTTFLRPLVGLRGELLSSWHWEVSGWLSHDRADYVEPGQLNATAVQAALNSTAPATALNPFIDGPLASSRLLQTLVTTYYNTYIGKEVAANGFVRGPLWHLPAGPVEVVMGGEFDHDSFDSENQNFPYGIPGDVEWTRRSTAVFGELRIPLIGPAPGSRAGDTLAVTAAGRYDHFDDFGGKTTPQFGLEWRPLDSLLVRGSYNRAFKAPSLLNLYDPQTPAQALVTDPKRGNQPQSVNATYGGNMGLRPETGTSRIFGLVYAGEDIPGLQLAVSQWSVDESNNIQNFQPQQLIDNEATFPGHVIRADSCAGGPPCPIVMVYPTYENFGHISVAGLDYQASYRYTTTFGQWLPAASATQTYHFVESLTPQAPTINAVSAAQATNIWAPRWKATAALGWQLGPYSASADGRYVGRYRDYGTTREIGNFWLFDANFRWAAGAALARDKPFLSGLYAEVGGVNLFNTLPQYSNYDNGYVGYDPAQSDIRGRFLYVKLGTVIK